jgi:hypothetical protein
VLVLDTDFSAASKLSGSGLNLEKELQLSADVVGRARRRQLEPAEVRAEPIGRRLRQGAGGRGFVALGAREARRRLRRPVTVWGTPALQGAAGSSWWHRHGAVD